MSATTDVSDQKILRLTFWGLGVIGTALTWGRTIADGTVGHLQEILNVSHTLPGSTSALRDSFTGIFPLDYLLRTLVVFFWEAVDGSHPAVTATGIYFVGQLFPIVVAIYLDGLRHGNGSSLVKPSVWFLIFGAAAIGSSGAAWGLAYTAVDGGSPTTSITLSASALRHESRVHSPRRAGLLLPATFLGYAVPLILMGLPSPTVVSNNFQQWAIVLWNTFPILMMIIVAVGHQVLEVTLPSSTTSTSSSSSASHLRVVRWLSAVSIAVGFALHISVAAVSVSADLFPALFNAQHVQQLSPWTLLSPAVSLAAGKTVGDGIRGFMYWDQIVGFSLVQLVFLAQLRNALRFSSFKHLGWTRLAATSAFLSLVGGPGTAVMALSWARDEILFGEEKKTDEHTRKRL